MNKIDKIDKIHEHMINIYEQDRQIMIKIQLISITFVVAFLSGIYGIFQVANTKDSLLYSKIGTSNSTN
ncbi:hypothetical protein YYC_00201 [Plasmodium yoelii 17X]|uniref:Uncharacterized protein n=1 Tax=Plasmodium yoelii 17X TaxID=1323249 RepID=V7PUZ7_PLAYE|nr:hypothetical protein YYC_00201 [Plasmodium yoelii 17X]